MMTPVALSRATHTQQLTGVNGVMGVACMTSQNRVTPRLQSAFYRRDVSENSLEITPSGGATFTSASVTINRRSPSDPVASDQRYNGRRTTLADITVTSLDPSSLPGYMRPTVVSYQKALVKRQHSAIKSVSRDSMSRPHSSVVVTDSFNSINTTLPVAAWSIASRQTAVHQPSPRRYGDENWSSETQDNLRHLTSATSRILPALPGPQPPPPPPPPPETVVDSTGLAANMRPESGRSCPCSDSNDSNNTSSRQQRLHRPKRLAVVEVRAGDAAQSRTSPASHESSHYSQHSNDRVPPLTSVVSSHQSMPADETCTLQVIRLDNTVSSGNQSSQRKVGWSRETTAISHAHQLPTRVDALGTVASLYRTRSIGTLPQRLTDVGASRTQRNPVIPTVTGPGRSSLQATVRAQQSAAKRPATTTTKGSAANKTSMVKSKSQPSFRTMLEPWSRDKELAPRNGTKDHEDRLRNIEGVEVVEEETFDDVVDDDELSDEEDEEEAATRHRIEEWLEQMVGLVFEAPPTPEIDDDSPLQTDTAIHIVYEGD